MVIWIYIALCNKFGIKKAIKLRINLIIEVIANDNVKIQVNTKINQFKVINVI